MNFSFCRADSSVSSITVYIPNNVFVPPGDVVQLTMTGVTNPPSGDDFSSIRIFSSSDLKAVSPTGGSFS